MTAYWIFADGVVVMDDDLDTADTKAVPSEEMSESFLTHEKRIIRAELKARLASVRRDMAENDREYELFKRREQELDANTQALIEAEFGAETWVQVCAEYEAKKALEDFDQEEKKRLN